MSGPRRPEPADFAGIHVLADDDPRWKHSPLDQARAACAGGAAVVQLRAKHAGDRQALDWAEAIAALCREAGARFVMNDRFDLAALAGADAVHLGQDDLPPGRIPADLRRDLAVGRSTHTPEQLRAAGDEPLDYVAFGPLFGTRSKDSPWEPRGLEALARAAATAAPRPLIAIGGIEAGTLADVARAGARGAAVISAVAGADDPEAATRALVRSWAAARERADA